MGWLEGLVQYELPSDLMLCSVDKRTSFGAIDHRLTTHWSTAIARCLLDVWGDATWPVNDCLLEEGMGGLDWPAGE